MATDAVSIDLDGENSTLFKYWRFLAEGLPHRCTIQMKCILCCCLFREYCQQVQLCAVKIENQFLC